MAVDYLGIEAKMDSSATQVISFFTAFRLSDMWYLAQAALNTLVISILAIGVGSFLGIIFGWILAELNRHLAVLLNVVLDIFRSVPLIIQLILFYNFFPIIGLPLKPFTAGTIVLTVYTSSLVAQVARSGIDATPIPTRRAGRSLGMTYFQDLRYLVFPIGLRAMLPAWTGVALGVLKDSALVSVLGYVELLRASQILVTRTQEPFIILTIVGAFYFMLSYPIARITDRVERKWQND